MAPKQSKSAHGGSNNDAGTVLALNAGSSSIKFALYDLADSMTRRLRGKIERIGVPGTKLTIEDPTGAHVPARAIDASDPAGVTYALIDWLEEVSASSALTAVGHRVVHGGSLYSSPARIDDALLAALRGMSAYSPEHLPMQIDRKRPAATPCRRSVGVISRAVASGAAADRRCLDRALSAGA